MDFQQCHSTPAKIWFVTGLIGFIMVLSSCDTHQERIIATADNLVVKDLEFIEEYRAWLLKTGVQDLPNRRILFAKDMAATRLAVKEARGSGIEDELHYQQRLERVERRLRIDDFVEQVVLDSVEVTEAQVRELYVRAQSTIVARQLYARTQQGADSLRSLLMKGHTFTSLALDVFNDPTLRNSGGLLPPFTFDEMDSAFEDTAFYLPIGHISQPIQTPQGYFILKVEDRFTRPIITETEFYQKRHLFEAYAMSRARGLIRRNYLHQRIKDANVRFDDTTVQQLFKRITPGTSVMENRLDSRPLVSFEAPRQEWTVEVFREHARFSTDRQRAQVRSLADLKDLIQGLIASELILQEASSLPMTTSFQDRLQDAMDRYIVQYLHQQDIPQITEEEARSYYESAPSQEFRQPAQIQLTWTIFPTQKEAQSVREFTYPSGPALFDAEMLGEFSVDLFRAEEGEFMGPYPVSGQWILFRVGPQFPSRKQTFLEAQEVAFSILRDEKLRENRLTRYSQLVSKYSLIIHEDLIHGLSLTVDL